MILGQKIFPTDVIIIAIKCIIPHAVLAVFTRWPSEPYEPSEPFEPSELFDPSEPFEPSELSEPLGLFEPCLFPLHLLIGTLLIASKN